MILCDCDDDLVIRYVMIRFRYSSSNLKKQHVGNKNKPMGRERGRHTHTHVSTHVSEDLDYDHDNSKNHNTPDKKTLDLHLLLAVRQ